MSVVSKKNKLFLFSFCDRFYIALILLWQIIQNYIGVDGKGRVPFTMTFFYIGYSFFVNKKTLFSMPLCVWWLWVVYALINTFFIQGTSMPSGYRMLFCTHVIAGPLLISGIMRDYLRNKKSCLRFIGIVLLVYTSCAMFEPYQMDEVGHGISEFGNIVPITIVFLVFVFSVRFVSKSVSEWIYVLVLILSIVAIVVSATRKAFGGVVIVVFFTYLAYMKKLSFKTIVFTILLGLIAYISFLFLEDTLLWNRFAASHAKSSMSEYSDSIFLSAMGDRAIMYVEGWNVFLNNKWLGIGLRNFCNDGYYAFVLHSEYMVQLTECGIVGTFLYAMFGISIIVRLLHTYKYAKQMMLVCFGGLLAILFISFTAWTYNQPVFFVGLGVILSFTSYVKSNRNCRLIFKQKEKLINGNSQAAESKVTL